MGDANVPSIIRLRDDVALGRYRTLAFTEFEKIYQRNPQTAANVEGHLRAFIDEGFQHSVHEDNRMSIRKAYCLVLGAMTPQCYNRHYSFWQDSGFARRFLWMHYALADPGIITEAIHRWQKIKLPGIAVLQMDEQELPYTLRDSESKELQKMLEVDANTPFILLKKIAVVLKHCQKDRYMEILRDVAPCFKGEGGELEIERSFENEKSESHHRATAGPAVRGGRVRRRSRRTSKGANHKAVRIPRLEAERKLSTMPAGSVGDHAPQGERERPEVKEKPNA